MTFRSILSLLTFSFFSSTALFAQIHITEIMFNPQGADYYHEFVELYNASDSVAIDLNGWSISDGSSDDQLLAVSQGFILAPYQFAIVLDPGYFENEHIYDAVIPEQALVLTIDDASFGTSGFSNTKSETVSLIDINGNIISSYTYSTNNLPHYSDEKIILAGSNSPDNWANSKIYGGTPGAQNSVTPVEYDAEIDFLPLIQSNQAGSRCELKVKISNVGILPIRDAHLKLFYDINQDSIIDETEFYADRFTDVVIEAGDSTIISFDVYLPTPGFERFIAIIDMENDLNELNDRAWIDVPVGYPHGILVINEIMFRPHDFQPEWVEIMNTSDSNINLKGWMFSDSKTTSQYLITAEDMILGSNEYFILAEDNISDNVNYLVPEHWPALNNSSDSFVLYDITGTVIDSAFYTGEDVTDSGVSLERKDPFWSGDSADNWGPSTNPQGHTMGMQNSELIPMVDLAIAKISANPVACEPGCDLTILVEVVNIGQQTVSDFEISLYHDLNFNSQTEGDELIGRETLPNHIIEKRQSMQVLFTWSNIPSGVHSLICTIHTINDSNKENDIDSIEVRAGYPKGSLVINEIMYDPIEKENEWIEIYNISKDPVNLQYWALSDSNTSRAVPISNEPLMLDSKSYLILSRQAQDQTINHRILPEFPTLNNSTDQIYLFDNVNNIIETVAYSAKWGGPKGYSLERINPNVDANNAENWGQCVNSLRHTMGVVNSIYIERKSKNQAITVSPNPFSPDDDGHDDITMINYRIPVLAATVNVKIYDVSGRMVRFLTKQSLMGTEDTIVWNGFDDNNYRCRMGIYIVYFEAISPEKGVVLSEKTTVVLASEL